MQHTLLAVSAPPFWHCGRTIWKSNMTFLLALLPAVVMAGINWGIPALRVMALSVSTAVAAEALGTRLTGRPLRVDNFDAALIGLLFSFMLPSAAPWWLVMFGSAICILIGKIAFGGLGASPLCPPVVGWAALFISWPLLMDPNTAELSTSFIDPLVRLKYFGMTAVQDMNWTDLLLGRQIGGLGASQTAALLMGGLFLCARGVIRWEIPCNFLIGVAATAAAFHLARPELYASPLFHLLTGTTLFGAFVLATCMSCSPNREIPMILYGLAGGVLVVLIRNLGMYADGVPFAILLINLLMPQLEMIRPKPFGGR